MLPVSPNYQVIATLGPATLGPEAPDLPREMLRSGATAFRLNTSHISLEDLLPLLNHLRRDFPETPITLDLQGSKWRLGAFIPFVLSEGEEVVFFHGTGDGAGESAGTGLPVPHGDFFSAASAGTGSGEIGEIRLNDGRIVLELLSASGREMRARVRAGGEISPRKGLTLPGSPHRTETLGDKDTRILAETRGMERVKYAFSYVRDGVEMRTFRSLAGPGAAVIAKIERAEALAEVDAIAAVADELWLCRGDLGAELGLPEMARRTHGFTRQVREYPVPSLLAGQVLEHMTGNPVPTRSEMCHLYDALQAGYAGFVLSDETALGKYPVESCRHAASLR
ncbi:MAG: hypothetical protein EA427_02020 [Spirochaetaceae bacterium]|nr:MAG: hypothetical protein EA427_02020 [Spirochaetaceae bacterium]